MMNNILAILALVAFIALPIGIVGLIVTVIRKRKRWIWGIVIVASLVLIIGTGLVIYALEPPASNQTGTPAPIISMLDGATRFTGTLPSVADLTYTTRGGDTLAIQGYPGFISLFVDPDTTRSVVEEKLKTFDAQVVGAIPLAGLYLVQVTSGQESALTLDLYSESWVRDSSPAFPAARGADHSVTMATLDFHTRDLSKKGECHQLHGDKVKVIMQRSGREVLAIDVDPIGTENDLLLPLNMAARVLEEMERASKAKERLVINISLQAPLTGWSSMGRSGCHDEDCRALRNQQYIFYNSFLQAMEAMFKEQPEVVDNALITFIAGNAGVDLDSTLEKLGETAPNAIERVKFVGGANASGKVLKKYNHLMDTSDKGNRMVYARGEDVSVDKFTPLVCNGTSFAGPEVARVLDLIWSRNPELTSIKLLEAFDKALAEMGIDNVLPQDKNGWTTLAFINRVAALATPTLTPSPSPMITPNPTPEPTDTPSSVEASVTIDSMSYKLLNSQYDSQGYYWVEISASGTASGPIDAIMFLVRDASPIAFHDKGWLPVLPSDTWIQLENGRMIKRENSADLLTGWSAIGNIPITWTQWHNWPNIELTFNAEVQSQNGETLATARYSIPLEQPAQAR
ncbi:S8/S53 family peptidase [Chloroflexota bacterium]